MTQWIIEKLVGFIDIGLLRISESVRAYAYLILSPRPLLGLLLLEIQLVLWLLNQLFWIILKTLWIEG